MFLGQKVSERGYWVQYVATLVLTLASLIAVSLYTFTSFSGMAKEDAIRFGENAVQKDAKALNNFLLKNRNLIDVASLVIDDEIAANSSNEKILAQLVSTSKNFSRLSDDSSYSGVYGFIRGEYMDGTGWVPPEDFSVRNRPWYQEAFKARGEIALSAPYADARTPFQMISISRRLSDKQSVVSIDIELEQILKKIRQEQDGEDGFWLIMDKNGFVIGHSDSSQQGMVYLDTAYWETEKELLARKILISNSERFDISLSGKKYIAFPELVMNSWFLVRLSDESVLFERVRWILVRSIMLSLLVFLLVCFFCTMSFRNRIRALRSSRAKSIFLANMSHEIRTPINGILGMNSIILKEMKNPELMDYAVNVQNAGQSLLSIINDILDFSKIESGKMVIKASEYNLFNVLSDCFNIISPRATAKNLRFSIECDPEMPSCLWGDEVRIRQIISNLLSNAVKYTEYGEVSLSVNFTALPSKNTVKADNSIILKIQVRDTGIGIRSDELDKIFNSFQRVDQKRNRNVEGTGLGLSLTKKLVEMCGGEITVRSRYEEGSTFMVNIPQVVLNVEPMGDFSSKFRQQNTLKTCVTESLFAPNARILVVDDVNLNLKVIRGLLKDSRAKVETAVNGAQCLQMVKSKHYDIIFLDHMMPVMDGLETFERMKGMGDDFVNKGTPVIMLTANAVVGAKESYLHAGFTDYLSKPVKESDLIRVLKRYLPEHLILTPDDLLNCSGENTLDEMSEAKKRKQNGTTISVEPPVKPASTATVVPEIPAVPAAATAPATSTVPATSTAPADGAESMMDALKKVLDVELGLSYCANDEEFFVEMLEEYTSGNKLDTIREDFEKQDWKDYQILVHALKSTSLTIGAKELSEKAKALEFACKESNIDYVLKNHQQVMDEYSQTLKSIGLALEKK